MTAMKITVMTLRFNDFELDLMGPILRREGHEVHLRPQSLKVLAYLAERPAQVITSDELIINSWEKPRETNINSVTQRIADIRSTLGASKRSIIRTVPRKGYVFVASISPVAASNPAVESRATRLPTDFGTVHPAERTTLARPPLKGHLHRLWDLRGDRRVVGAGFVLLAVVAIGTVSAAWMAMQARPGHVLTMMTVPTIAVPPFARSAINGDEDGVDTDLADELAIQIRRVPRGFRIALRSASTVNWKRGPLPRGETVRYLVLGSIRSEGPISSLNLQLV